MDKYGYYKVKIKVPKDRRGFMSRIFPGLFRLSRIRGAALNPSAIQPGWMHRWQQGINLKPQTTMVSKQDGHRQQNIYFYWFKLGPGTGLVALLIQLYTAIMPTRPLPKKISQRFLKIQC